jgi:hypothetical protein
MHSQCAILTRLVQGGGLLLKTVSSCIWELEKIPARYHSVTFISMDL